jgi:heme/copper-type cytochrome/quinol oxidase subunit 2
MINIIVESQEDYDKWLKEQKTFIAKEEPKKDSTTPSDTTNKAVAAVPAK